MIIGFTGPSGSHKTVGAKHLQKQYGFDRIHAGDPIKNGLRKSMKLRRRQVSGKAKDKPAAQLAGATPRSALEAQGIATHRVAPGATAARVHQRLMKRVTKGKSVAVDGIRTPQEAEAVRRMGGTIVRMDNGKGPNPSYPMDKVSEDVKADHRIDTSGSKGDIKRNVDQLMQRHLGLSFAAGAEPTSNKGTQHQGGVR